MGKRYKLIDTKMTWNDSKAYCESNGGYPATITSEDENLFVYDNLTKTSGYYCWYGGTDKNAEGTWEWITGEPWDYTDWLPGQPDDNGNEDYLHAHSSSKGWNDHKSYWEFYPISEYSNGLD